MILQWKALLKNYYININNIKELNTEEVIIGIAANKSDLYENQEVRREEGAQFAKKLIAYFMKQVQWIMKVLKRLLKD